ncbi:MAG: acyl carrier protein [Oscillospiraceae bacterium]|jgi:acyl carrier protein
MFEEIAKIIAEQFGVEVDTITPDTTFEEDLGADSIDIVELSMALEDEYAIGEMSEDDLAGISTVGDLVQYIQGHVEE